METGFPKNFADNILPPAMRPPIEPTPCVTVPLTDATIGVPRGAIRSLPWWKPVSERGKPQSFMNVSGPAVRRVCGALDAGPEDLILVYDDIDMELGKVRTRLKGSAGGHNGVKSIIETLGTDAIRRVKIGIGRPEHKAHVPDHVLTTFEPDEEEIVAAAVATAAERVLGLLSKA